VPLFILDAVLFPTQVRLRCEWALLTAAAVDLLTAHLRTAISTDVEASIGEVGDGVCVRVCVMQFV
jgi:hypothetical protein